ncbi:MAG: hypothetical protein HZC51_09215 [Nitrospirae bacterium]|nr:hypothetical protein [Nitrospirota bacterium]
MGGVVVIAAALPMEVAGILKPGRFAEARIGNVNYLVGGVHGVDAAIFVSGMGGARAYETAKAACAGLPARAYISLGLSAALDAGLAPGDVVVGESVAFAGPGGDAPQDIIGSSPALLVAAHRALYAAGVRFGPLLASDTVAVTSVEKVRLAGASGCVALDMESYGAARAAKDAGVPFIAIRAVSDGLGEDLPVNFNVYTKSGRMDWPRFALHVISHPWIIPGLMRLGRGSRLASANLAYAVQRLMRTFS